MVDLWQMLLPDNPNPTSLGQSVTFHLVWDAFELSKAQWSLETFRPPLPPVTTSRHISDPGFLPSAHDTVKTSSLVNRDSNQVMLIHST